MTVDKTNPEDGLLGWLLHELEVRAWYHERTGKHIKSRAHLSNVMKDYALARAVETVLDNEDGETG